MDIDISYLPPKDASKAIPTKDDATVVGSNNSPAPEATNPNSLFLKLEF
jgi:hypothetical protein